MSCSLTGSISQPIECSCAFAVHHRHVTTRLRCSAVRRRARSTVHRISRHGEIDIAHKRTVWCRLRTSAYRRTGTERCSQRFTPTRLRHRIRLRRHAARAATRAARLSESLHLPSRLGDTVCLPIARRSRRTGRRHCWSTISWCRDDGIIVAGRGPPARSKPSAPESAGVSTTVSVRAPAAVDATPTSPLVQSCRHGGRRACAIRRGPAARSSVERSSGIGGRAPAQSHPEVVLAHEAAAMRRGVARRAADSRPARRRRRHVARRSMAVPRSGGASSPTSTRAPQRRRSRRR